MRHPRHRTPPPIEDKGIEPYDVILEAQLKEMDEEFNFYWDSRVAAADERFARSVDHR